MKKNNKLFRAIAAVIALLLLSLCAISCSKNDDNSDGDNSETVFYTVKFDTVGGSSVASMKVPAGTKITPPHTPTKPNYLFVEWRKGGLAWSFDDNSVNEDITLSAIWVSADSVFETQRNAGGNTLTVTGIKELPKNASLTIPQTINGYTVTAIGDGAFAEFFSDYITSVILPETVVSVGDFAFEEFPVDLTVRGRLSHVGEGAFMGAMYLKEIKLAEGMDSIPFSAFSGTALKTLIVPDGVTLIKEDALKDCASLVTIVLPQSLTDIENSAFHGCTAFKTAFFKGDSKAYESITVAEMNDSLTEAKTYYYSEEKPTEEKQSWHFDSDGVPRIW